MKNRLFKALMGLSIRPIKGWKKLQNLHNLNTNCEEDFYESALFYPLVGLIALVAFLSTFIEHYAPSRPVRCIITLSMSHAVYYIVMALALFYLSVLFWKKLSHKTLGINEEKVTWDLAVMGSIVGLFLVGIVYEILKVWVFRYKVAFLIFALHLVGFYSIAGARYFLNLDRAGAIKFTAIQVTLSLVIVLVCHHLLSIFIV